MKSFDQTFSKVCAGRGREALVARRNGRNFLGVFGSFCARGVKKNGANFLNVTRPASIRSFFDQVGTKKELKKCRITGLCPEPRSLFEKSDAKTFIEDDPCLKGKI